jgi:hypothetical protein
VPPPARVPAQVRELTERDGAAGLAIGWGVTGPGGGLFPVPDEGLTLYPAGDDATPLTRAGG